MEANKENILSHSMYSGFYLGIGTSILNILGWSISLQNSFLHSILSLATCFVTLYCVFHFTRLYDSNVLSGEITYGKAFAYGIRMFFFAAMILAVSTFAFFYLFPDALQRMVSEVTNSITMIGAKDEESQKMITEIKSYTPRDLSLSMLSGYSFAGLFVCLLTSIAFRKKNSDSGLLKES